MSTFIPQRELCYNLSIVTIRFFIQCNPMPRTYVRGIGALPLQGGQNIHPRAYARGILWYGVNPAS